MKTPSSMASSAIKSLSKVFSPLLLFTFCLALLSCTSATTSAKYIKNSSDYTSIGIDYHDMDMVVENNAKSLLQSEFVSNMKESKLLAISDILNETGEDIDVEILTRKLVREIRKSKRFALTNAIAGSGANADKLITTSRNLTNDKNFNQYTTQESGTLQAPELSLSGKFIKRAKNIGKTTRIDYIFLLTLSDIKTGKVLWDNEEIISKAIDTDKVGEHNATIPNTPTNTLTREATTPTPESTSTKTTDKELEALRKECKSGKEKACQEMDERNDIDGFKILCENNSMAGCFGLGLSYYNGSKVGQDFAEAKRLFEKACSGGYAHGCFFLGLMNYSSGEEGLEQDRLKARKLFEKACEGGSAPGCYGLGEMHYFGKEVKQDYAKARELFKKACDGDMPESCASLGTMHMFGQGVPQNYTAAKEFLKKACKAKSLSGCYNLGVLYMEGKGVEQSYLQAKELFEQACNRLPFHEPTAKACYNLGIMYSNGLGVRQSFEDAHEYYKRACIGREALGCRNLAVLYYNGQGVKQNRSIAKEYFGQACDLGEQKGCEGYKMLQEQGY